MENIKLTYDEKNIHRNVNVSKQTDVETGNLVVTTRTIVNIPCIFESRRLNQELEEFGFVNVPECVRNIMDTYGFKYSHKYNGWYGVATGIATHVANITADGTTIQDDVYSEEFGYNVAMTKAKCNAQYRAGMIMSSLAGVFDSVADLFRRSASHFSDVLDAEEDAKYRAMETGYCDPNLSK